MSCISPCAFLFDSARVEIGFGADHRQSQTRADAVLRRQLVHQTDDLLLHFGDRHDDILAIVNRRQPRMQSGTVRRRFADETLHLLRLLVSLLGGQAEEVGRRESSRSMPRPLAYIQPRLNCASGHPAVRPRNRA
jgi:hypothetical protein